jgi:hypothetical protein
MCHTYGLAKRAKHISTLYFLPRILYHSHADVFDHLFGIAQQAW